MDGVYAAGVEEDALCERGLPRVDVGGDANIAHPAELMVLGCYLLRQGTEPPASMILLVQTHSAGDLLPATFITCLYIRFERFAVSRCT